jgi:AbrB family looped-hinge helix DNA binding protein
MASVAATVFIDKSGRFVLPKSIRDALNLVPGTTLEIEQQGDTILLRPPRTGAVMTQKNGFWIFDTGGRITPEMVNQALSELPQEQDQGLNA